jgi:hypothetical protein
MQFERGGYVKGNLFPTPKSWCKKMGIKGYEKNTDDKSITVNGDVDLTYKGLTELPYKFEKVTGNFWCDNNNLTSLNNSPNEIGGSFSCTHNNLITFEDKPNPQKIGGNFWF